MIFLSGCYRYPEIDWDYELYNRLIGPDGGTITFYANYTDDTNMFFADTTKIMLTLDVPQGALDSMMIFNFYQYQSYENAEEMSKGLSKIGSKFIYFVPIYASDGYHEHDEADLTYHLSVEFNQPITVTYFYTMDYSLDNLDEKKLQFEFYNWFNRHYKLYRIKIPRIDEWGENRNIFVQWNQQGYPIGYNDLDLNDIILGKWYPFTEDYQGVSSLVNWEPVKNFTIDEVNKSVSFDIENTDYMYVLAHIIQISNNIIPFRISEYIANNFTSNLLRAALIDGTFQIILEDGTVVYFDKSSDFLYAEKYNVPYSQIPQEIIIYLNSNYPSSFYQGNIKTIYSDISIYRINLSDSKCLFFYEYGGTVNYFGSMVYDYDFNSLPQGIIDYINSNFPNAIINTVTNFDALENPEINIYLTYQSKNIKLFFYNQTTPNSTVYYGLKLEDISDAVLNYLNSEFNNIDIVKITQTICTDSSYYYINLIDDTDIEIDTSGNLLSLYRYISIQEIPAEIINGIDEKFESCNLVTAYYIYRENSEIYAMEFAEGLYVEMDINKTVIYAGGSNIQDLPETIRSYIRANYDITTFNNFDYYYNYEHSQYLYFVYLDNLLLIFDENGNLITKTKDFEVKTHSKAWEKSNKKHQL